MKTFAFSSLFLLCLSIPALAQHRSVEDRHREYLAKRQAAPPPASSAPAPSATVSVPSTPPIPGAPPLPTAPLDLSKYPTPDVVPPTDSPEVKQWLDEIKNANIPNLSKTVNGDCAASPQQAADASRCWWTCGGCTRDTDITKCPDKLSWGVSYDDGPSEETPRLLNFLDANQLKATFFLIGSRVYYNPDLAKTEYLKGHQLSVHTWSHYALTNLTNEQIVAELGWTKKIIKEITGVTPNTMRPPYGDIDDRVRAISLAMGLTPILWTGVNGVDFDTEDWRVGGGLETADQSLAAFTNILANASNLDSGFIVLEHDLYKVTVDLAIDHFLPLALHHQPPFNVQPIFQCLHKPLSSSYIETAGGNGTNTNSTQSSTAPSSPSHTSGGAASPSASTHNPNAGEKVASRGFALSVLALLAGGIFVV